jgi:hypothetical protein
LSAMRRKLGAMGESDPWAPGSNEDAPRTGRVQTGTHGGRGPQAVAPEKRENRGRYRRRALKRPNTSSTSPKQIEMAKRRAKALELRLQGYTYEVIADHLGSSKSVIAKDITRAMADLVTEPAERVFRMEMRRLDALTAAHYASACDGDIPAGQMMLRIIEMRGRMLGFFDKERAAGRFTITDASSAGAPRRLELEFVLPGKRIADMDGLDAISPPCSRPSSPSSSSLPSSSSPSSRTMDLKANPPSNGVSITPWKKPGGTGWMGD